MSDARKVVRVSKTTEESIRAYAEKRGINIGEAADRLIGTAVSRLASLERYGSGPVKPRGPARKAAKKSAAKKKSRAAKPDAENAAPEQLAEA